MSECTVFSCPEAPTHEVTLRDARLTYTEPPADESANYCAEHADTYRGDERCIIRPMDTGGA